MLDVSRLKGEGRWTVPLVQSFLRPPLTALNRRLQSNMAPTASQKDSLGASAQIIGTIAFQRSITSQPSKHTTAKAIASARRITAIYQPQPWFSEFHISICPFIDGKSSPSLYILYHTLTDLSIPFEKFVALFFRRDTSKLFGLRYRKTLPPITLKAWVIYCGFFRDCPLRHSPRC